MKAFLQKYHNIKYLIGFMLLEVKTSPQTIITNTFIDQYILLMNILLYYSLVYFYSFRICLFYIYCHSFKRICYYMFTGMSISLIIYI